MLVRSSALLLLVLPAIVAAQNPDDRESAFSKWVETRPLKLLAQYESRLNDLGLASKDSIPLFASRIDDKDVKVRRAATKALRLIGNRDPAKATPALLRAAKDPNQRIRGDALAGLGSISHPSASTVAVVAEALDNDKHNSYIAARALAKFGAKSKPAVGSLIKALGDNSSLTRASAADALGSIGPESRRAVPALRAAWKDKDEAVRLEAAFAIWRIDQSNDTINIFIDALRAEEFYVVLRAIEALGKVGSPARGALPSLEKVERQEDQLFAVAASWAIGEIRKTKNLLEQITSELDHQDPMARVGAAWALSQMGPEACVAIPKLRQLLENPDHQYGLYVIVMVNSLKALELEEP